MKDFRQRVLDRMPSPEEEGAVLGRVWNQVGRAGGQIPDDVLRSVQQRSPSRHRRAWTFLPKAVAAVLVLGVAIGTAMVWPRGARVYAAGIDGLHVTLADDSRVEMRAHAEMTVGRASDGIQIDLKTGDIIVTAAQRRDGHLYVRTRDMTIDLSAGARRAKADGTVFLVNAGQDGSRVGVIEGEVRVREQGPTLPVSVETRLRPGEAMATGPIVARRPLADDIMWSRNAELHRAVLESFSRARSSSPLTPVVPLAERQQGTGAASSAAVEFEEASIRECDPDNPPLVPRGGRSGGTHSFYMTPGRTYGLCITLATLIRTAYGYHPPGYGLPGLNNSPIGTTPHVEIGFNQMARLVENGERVRGGPDWVRSQLYTIEAVADGSATAAMMRGPMLRALLARRFGLKVHIETEQIPAFALTVAPGGLKMKEGTCTVDEAILEWARTSGISLDTPGLIPPSSTAGWLRNVERIRRGENTTSPCGTRYLVDGLNRLQIGAGTGLPNLNPILDAEVLDRTGIPATVRFNYVLEFLPDASLSHAVNLAPALDNSQPSIIGKPTPEGRARIEQMFGRTVEEVLAEERKIAEQRRRDQASMPPAPDLFTALEEQLGLKLVPARAPHEIIVIDQVQRPAPN